MSINLTCENYTKTSLKKKVNTPFNRSFIGNFLLGRRHYVTMKTDRGLNTLGDHVILRPVAHSKRMAFDVFWKTIHS